MGLGAGAGAMTVITTILHCTTCGAVVEDTDFEGNYARIAATKFPGAVEPVKCSKHRSYILSNESLHPPISI